MSNQNSDSDLCAHLRKTIESDASYRERRDRGEDPMWYYAECKDCGAVLSVAAPYQVDKRHADEFSSHGAK